MLLYHFTSIHHIHRIMVADTLTRTEANLHPTIKHYGVDVVWLLDTPTVEHDHGLAGSVADKTRVRFTVEVPDQSVKRWLDWKATKRMDPAWKAVLIKTGGGIEAATHWWVSLREIPSECWVEVRDMQADQLLWTP